MDWPRFWGQFTETIEKADIAPINKFTYLCGLLGPKVKTAVEALKIEAEEDLGDISTWNSEIDLQLMKADEEVEKLRKWLEDRRRQEETTAREDQLKFEMKLHEQKMKLQTSLSTQGSHEGERSPKQTQAKLPKIEIKRFEGSYLDWPRLSYHQNILNYEPVLFSSFRLIAGYVSVKSKLQHPPPGIPRAFDVFSCPGGREFD